MDLWRLTTVVARRWRVTLPLLLLAGAAVVAVAATTAPDYRSVAYVQLIPPQRVPDEGASATGHNNPWAQLGLHALGHAAVLAAHQPGVVEALAADGLSEEYTVSLDRDFPLIEIETTAGTPEQAARTTARLTALVTGEIARQQRQLHAPPEQTIQTLVLADGGSAVPDVGSRRKVVLASAVLAVMVTGAAGVLVDAVASRRARRRAAGPESAAAPAETAAPTEATTPAPAEPETVEPADAATESADAPDAFASGAAGDSGPDGPGAADEGGADQGEADEVEADDDGAVAAAPGSTEPTPAGSR